MAYVDKRKVLIFSLSALLLAVVVLALFFGCQACNTDPSNRKITLTQAELDALIEAAAEARLAELLAEQERLAQEEAERTRLEAERLEAERRAADARRRASAGNASSQQNNQTYRSTESNANNPFVGIWANDGQTIVFRFRDNGVIEVLNYTLVDEMVDVKFVTNRALTGGGYNTFSNPADFESTYTGTGTYTVNKDTVSFQLNMKNHQGTEKVFKHSSKFTINNNKDALRLASGMPRKFVINRNSLAEVEDQRKDFVANFTRR